MAEDRIHPGMTAIVTGFNEFASAGDYEDFTGNKPVEPVKPIKTDRNLAIGECIKVCLNADKSTHPSDLAEMLQELK